MIVMVGNKLPHDVIVTLVVVPYPESTLYIFVSANLETIEESVRVMGGAGERIAQETLTPNGVFRRHDVIDTERVRAESEDVLRHVSTLRTSMTVYEEVKTCQVIVVPSGRSAAHSKKNHN